MKALRLCMALFFTGLLIGCSSSSGGGGSTTSSSSSSSGGTSSSSSSSSGGPVEGVPFTGLPLDMDFGLPGNEFFGGTSVHPADPDFVPEGLFLAISDDATEPFYKVFSSGSRILNNLTNNSIRFGNAGWYAGKASADASNSSTLPDGDMDLSTNYRITMEITDLPSAGGTFLVRVDNNTNDSPNSIHGTASQILSITPDPDTGLTLGTLIINVPGDVTMNGDVVDTVDEHIGTPNSFLGFRCPSNCGDATAPDTGGIEISSIVVDIPGGAVLQPPRALQDAPEAAGGDQVIDVSWNPVGNATAYDVAYSLSDDVGAAIDVIEDITDTSVTIDEGLTNGTEYFVFVRAKNGAGESDYNADGVSVTPDVAPDTAPVVTLGAQIERLDVSWTAVDGAATYDIVINTTGTAPDAGDPPTIADIPSTATSTIAAGLTGGTPYFVFVRGNNLAGNGPYGSETATPTAVPAASEDRVWGIDEGGELEQAILDSILEAGTLNEQRDIIEPTDALVNGLHYFQNASGPLRHRGASNSPNRAWNYNGSSWDGSRTRLPATGELVTTGLRYADDDDCNNEVDSTEAGTVRAYIGVPVTVGAEVTVSATYRHGNVGTASIVAYVGDNDIVICQFTAEGTTADPATTDCALPDAHPYSEVRIFFSRECEGGGGLDLMGIERAYAP